MTAPEAELPINFTDQNDETPDKSWPHFEVWHRIRECLYALPAVFRTDVILPTIPAADLYAANSLLGTTIESQIPVVLNQMRNTWDPTGEYADWVFKRQPQVFPDVLFLKESSAGRDIGFGIEIKGWYLFAREAEPSFRFCVSSSYCQPADLAVVVPWTLSSAVSGTVRVFRPLVVGAKKAARLRTEHWIRRKSKESAEIIRPAAPTSARYPSRTDAINDVPRHDNGGNFGRIARCGVWEADVNRLYLEEEIAGIPIGEWQKFLKSFGK